jgi:DNA-binding CsgD family transcriptional regulator
MMKGHAIKQMARDLRIAPATVKAHLRPILRAIGVVSRSEAIHVLYRLGFSLESDFG